MFRKLRNHFVLINLVTTTMILVAAFSAVYFIASNSSKTRRPIPIDITMEFSDNEGFNQVMENRILADREASLKSLLVTLITTGFAVEVIVAIFSFIFAEQAIKPVKEAYNAQKNLHCERVS